MRPGAARDPAAVQKPPARTQREARAAVAPDRAMVVEAGDQAARGNTIIPAPDHAGVVQTVDVGNLNAVACRGGDHAGITIVQPYNMPGREGRARAAPDLAAVFCETQGISAIVHAGGGTCYRAAVCKGTGLPRGAQRDGGAAGAPDRAMVAECCDEDGPDAVQPARDRAVPLVDQCPDRVAHEQPAFVAGARNHAAVFKRGDGFRVHAISAC